MIIETLSIYMVIILFAITLQFFATRYTYAQSWSKQAMIRNIAIALTVTAVIRGGNPALFLIVILLEVAMDFINYKFYSIDPWVSTKYLYSDYFESFVNNKTKPLQYYTRTVSADLRQNLI